MRILLVEDDREIASVLVEGFRERGLRVDPCATYAAGEAQVAAATYDVVILDVMLPGGSGFDLCRGMRTHGITAPVLMLTARDAVEDRVEGLESGADDYLVKPFAFAELLARVRALGRRPRTITPETIRVGDLEVQLGSRRVVRAGRPIRLTAKEFALLECFIQHQGQVVDRATITAYVWDDNHDPFTNVLDVLIRRLRRKIDDGFARQLIQTMRGAGYRFGP